MAWCRTTTQPSGGGVAAIPTSNGSATVRIFTTDPANPVQINNNIASNRGGGIYLDAESDNFHSGVLCAYDFRIDDNQGADGAAIYADSSSPTIGYDVGAEIYLNTIPPDATGGAAHCGRKPHPHSARWTAPPVPHATSCAAIRPRISIKCRRTGAVIAVRSAGSIQADPFSLRENSAATLLRLTGDDEAYVPAVQRNCLIADNHTQHELISVQDGRGFGINGCTLTGNTIDNGYVIYVNGRLTLVQQHHRPARLQRTGLRRRRCESLDQTT
jgi:parallel beta-helix repeat protein